MRQKAGRQRKLKCGARDSQERRLEPTDELKYEKRRNDIQKMGSCLIFMNARARGKKESINCIKRLHKRGQLELIKDWDYFHADEKELIKSLLGDKIVP